MKKTTVYLGEVEVERLRRMSAQSGRSQAELIREGVRRVVADLPKRTFHSMGAGRSDAPLRPEWDPDELYDFVMGKYRPG